MTGFRDRAEAGRRLGELLRDTELVEPIVLALPRGGVPVAFEVARIVDAPLEVFVTRKVGAPGHRELGVGALAEGMDQPLLDAETISSLGIGLDALGAVVAEERDEVARRVRDYRGERPLPAFVGHDVVLVDDGLATGVTAEASLRALAARHPRRLIMAVPVCSRQAAARIGEVAEMVCVACPAQFNAVGEWYDDFRETSDGEVVDLLDQVRVVWGTEATAPVSRISRTAGTGSASANSRSSP